MDTSSLFESVKVWSQFSHPILMWGLLGLSLYAAYAGFKWRKIRSADKEEKKELIKKDYRTKHSYAGSILLALLILGNLGGIGITYLNNGKLFLGPHLLVGLGMTALIAVSSALVPWMQKGNEVARYSHITLNLVLLGLFGWQAISGMDIVVKIVERLQNQVA
jgi:hypothetical protein